MFWRKKQSSQLTLADPAWLFGTPTPPRKKLDLVGEHKPARPPVATTISGNRKKFTSGEIPANSGNFRDRRES
jgi:hypothetical protein